jgi:hypothetical protein
MMCANWLDDCDSGIENLNFPLGSSVPCGPQCIIKQDTAAGMWVRRPLRFQLVSYSRYSTATIS